MPTTGKTHANGNVWTPADYKAVYPDGYQLGRELGIDSGEVERHRAFYIIDRTLPIGPTTRARPELGQGNPGQPVYE